MKLSTELLHGKQEGMKQQSASIQELKAELGTGLLAQLSSAERADLSALNSRLQALQADETAAQQKLLEAQVPVCLLHASNLCRASGLSDELLETSKGQAIAS